MGNNDDASEIGKKYISKKSRQEILEKRQERKLRRKLLQMQREEIKKYIPQRSHFADVTKISSPKKREDLSCKKAPKNKLLNMATG